MPRACTGLEISPPAMENGERAGKGHGERHQGPTSAATDLCQAQQHLQPHEETRAELRSSRHEQGEGGGQQQPAAQHQLPAEEPRAVAAQRLREAVAVEEGAEDDPLGLGAPVVGRGLVGTRSRSRAGLSLPGTDGAGREKPARSRPQGHRGHRTRLPSAAPEPALKHGRAVAGGSGCSLAAPAPT